jgi:leucyl-tRNA---protein transferase
MNEYFFRERLSAALMDSLWQQGWRHFGTYFFRYAHSYQEAGLYTVMPLRIRLANFRLSTSQQRVLKKNRDLRLEFKPAFVNDEVEALFHKHKQRFKHNVPESIYTFVSAEPAKLPCECQSLCLYRADGLLAMSYLDVGEVACSSVYQCFDRAYEKRSLGTLMILLAMQQALALGKQFYYPGYAYREPSHYDYKKRFVGLESYNWQHWSPLVPAGGNGLGSVDLCS